MAVVTHPFRRVNKSKITCSELRAAPWNLACKFGGQENDVEQLSFTEGDIVHVSSFFSRLFGFGRVNTPGQTLAYGLPDIAHVAWRENAGMQITPSVLLFIIAERIATFVSNDPAPFEGFFGESGKGKTSVTVGVSAYDATPLDYIQLVHEKMVARGPDAERLFDTLMKPFQAQPPNFERSMATAVLMMSSRFYNYTTSKCVTSNCITAICLGPSKKDWVDLCDRVHLMQTLIGNIPANGSTLNEVYMNDMVTTVEGLCHFAHNPNTWPHKRVDLLSNCFVYNGRGWILGLCDSDGRPNPAYFGWKDEETGDMLYEVHCVEGKQDARYIVCPVISYARYRVSNYRVFEGITGGSI